MKSCLETTKLSPSERTLFNPRNILPNVRSKEKIWLASMIYRWEFLALVPLIWILDALLKRKLSERPSASF